MKKFISLFLVGAGLFGFSASFLSAAQVANGTNAGKYKASAHNNYENLKESFYVVDKKSKCKAVKSKDCNGKK